MNDVTEILAQAERGDPGVAERLLPLIYDELRRLAAAKLAHEKPGHTLQATALVHEAYIKLVDTKKAQRWDSRGHFFAAAAEAMRRILVDQARRKRAERHGGERTRRDLDRADVPAPGPESDVMAVHEALAELERRDALKANLVKLRYFVGMTVPQAADALNISAATADRYWAYARAWLHNEIKRESRR